ncbi:MAG: DUF7282 domain-containing protein [Actinomycetes bacterium]
MPRPREDVMWAHPRLIAVAAATLLLAACTGDEAADATPASQSAAASAPAASSPAASVPQSPAASPGSVEPVGTVTDPQAELDVDDQVGRGRSVRVEDVLISNGTGHVGVFAANGRLLGAGKVSTTVRRLTISLDKPVPRTSELLAVLFSDDGDERFEAAADPRIVDEDGDFTDDSFDYRLR